MSKATFSSLNWSQLDIGVFRIRR